MPCCAPHNQLIERALASPIPIPPHPAATPVPVASSTPILLFPGENPSDLNGAPFTTLPASLLSSIPPNATPTPNPAGPGGAASRSSGHAASSPSASASFATLTSTRQGVPAPTPSTPSNAVSSDSSSSSTGASPTTIGIVVSLIILVILGVVGYAIYRFHLRKKLKGNREEVKLRPLLTGKMISRPTLLPMQGSQGLLDEKSNNFRRTRASFGSKNPENAPSKFAASKLATPDTNAEGTYHRGADHRQTGSLYNCHTSDILEAYGSEVSYPSTYAPQADHDWPVFKPSPAQIPRVHNIPDTYPTSPSEVEKFSPSPASPRSLNSRRLQNMPFKLPKPTLARHSQRVSYTQF